MQKILIILVMVLLAGITGYSLYDILHTDIQGPFVSFSVVLIICFTLVIILRYITLIYFSIIKNVQKTKDDVENRVCTDRVTILVPAYNEDMVIEASIQSLLAQTYPYIEVLVIDDGSKDRTYEYARRFEHVDGYKSVRALTKPNGGKSKALNFGIEHCSGDLIMVVDADSKLEPTAVELLVKSFNTPDIAAVAGSVSVINRGNTWANLQALEYIEGLNMVRNAQAYLQLVNIIPGPIGMFRKSALDHVGGYDHDTYAEDCDLTLKLIAEGYKIDFEPDAIAYTEAPEDLLDLIKQRYRWTRGILQAIRKHKEYLFNFRKRASTSMVLWYMLFEAIFWPFMDFWASVFFIYISATTGLSSLIVYWWAMFTVLDMAGALYCLLVTKEQLKLVFYAILYRLYFIGIINISKIFATIEEWFNIEMSWGKLERKGRI
jgi:poly-beta-1,6-N-acetyl-D-glucosamine synthase